MTVKEIFDLRKQGHIEEAYEGRTDEARKIYEALKRLAPSIQDKDGSVSTFMQKVEERLEGLNIPSLNKGQQAVLEAIKANEGIKVPGISEATNIPSKSIERHVSVLIAKGLIEHRGSKKAGGYYSL